MKLIEILDTCTNIKQLEIQLRFPEKVYRNKTTRRLDKEYSDFLYEGISPLIMGSCFTEGGLVLPLFINPSRLFGFYFGIEKKDVPKELTKYIPKLIKEGILELGLYKNKEIIFPKEFR